MHIFHTECITENIRAGNTKCPLCNKEISSEDVMAMNDQMMDAAGMMDP
mgnify:CR=1 FL=1